MKQASALLLVLLALGLTLACVFVGGREASGEAKWTSHEESALWPAGEHFRGTLYDNEVQLPAARGEINLVQPNGDADVMVAISADGLAPLAEYRVYFDTNGTSVNPPYGFGPWEPIGSFWADESGHGAFNYTAPAGTYPLGTYTWSVYINRADFGATILISDNLTFEISSGS